MIKVKGCAVACWYMFNSWLGGRARGQKTCDLWILPISNCQVGSPNAELERDACNQLQKGGTSQYPHGCYVLDG